MKRVFLAILLVLSMLSASKADSWKNYAPNTSEGKEFYVSFMHNNAQAGVAYLNLYLFFASRQTAHVTIYYADNNTIDTLTFIGSYLYDCSDQSPQAYSTVSDTITNKSVRITSDVPISVYMEGSNNYSGDASLVLPINVLDKEYIIQTPTKNKSSSEFLIVATEPDTTTIVITPSKSLTIGNTGNPVGRPANVPFTVHLTQGQVYFASSLNAVNTLSDLSGTVICADKAISVWNGGQDAGVSRTRNTSHVSHQAMPVSKWGKEFVVGTYASQLHLAYEVTASQNNTEVYEDGVLVQTLGRFQSRYVFNTLSDPTVRYIQTSKPASVVQFMSDDDDEGTPAMTYISPLEQRVSSICISTFTDSAIVNAQIPAYLQVLVPTNAVNSMLVDNQAYSSSFTAVPALSGYSFGNIPLSNGKHELANNNGMFSASVYGIYEADESFSYVYNAGLNCMCLDAHVNIDGVWTNFASKCKGSDSTWTFNLEAIVNVPYSSLIWYDSTATDSMRLIGSGSMIDPILTDPGLHSIKLLIYRNSVVCQDPVADTIKFDLYCASVYNYNLPPKYLCYGDTAVVFGDTILADTLTPYSPLTRTQYYNSHYSCDSIVTAYVMLLNPQDQYWSTVHLCEGDKYHFFDQTITQSGSYSHQSFQYDKCPYMVYQTVEFHPHYIFPTDTVVACATSYLWRDSLYSEPGLHYDSLKTKYGCDSVYSIYLIVGDVYLFEERDTVCDTELPYFWRGNEFNAAGVYYDSLKTMYGCDSVYRFVLDVNPSFHDSSNVEICADGVFVWQNHSHESNTNDLIVSGLEPGLYTFWDSLTTVNGCDSIYKLSVEVSDVYRTELSRNMCDYDTIHWEGRIFCGDKYTQQVPGAIVLSANDVPYTFSDLYQSVFGCDSIVSIVISVRQSYYQEIRKTICLDEVYLVNTDSMTWKNDVVGFYDTVMAKESLYGCDSTIHLYLKVNPVYAFEKYDTTCANQPYRWIDVDAGIDSVISQTVAKSDTYEVVKRTQEGCDSIFRLILTSLDTFAITDSVIITDQQSYLWENQWYRGTKSPAVSPSDIVLQSGSLPYEYSKRHTSSKGCDSIRILIITVSPTYDNYDTAVTCQHEDYDFQGQVWSWKKDYVGVFDTTYYYHTQYGADSIWHLRVYVKPAYIIQEQASTCANEPYQWEGHDKIFSNLLPGTHILFDSLTTIDGCDSIYRLTLNVVNTPTNHTVAEMCDNDTFAWDTIVFYGNKSATIGTRQLVSNSTPYTFTHVYTSSLNCDSFVTLSLMVHSTYDYYDTTIVTCLHEGYEYKGEPWTWRKDVVGVHDTLLRYSTINGCDSLWHVRVTVNPVYFIQDTASTCSNETYQWVGHNKSFSNLSPGVYEAFDSLTTNAGCDSIHRLTLYVADTLTNHTVAEMCDNDTFAWDTIVFYGNKSATIGTRQLISNATPYTFTHVYTSSLNCDSFVTLSLMVHPTYDYYDTTIVTCLHEEYEYQGEPWTWRKDVVGVHDTLLRYSTINGCDSLWHVRVTVNPVYFIQDTDYTCSNETYQWFGHNKSFSSLSQGIYVFYDSLKTDAGCDSIHQLTLNVMDTLITHTVGQMCDNGTFTWDTIVFYGNKSATIGTRQLVSSATPYTFTHVYTSSLNCDSFVTLTLMVYPTYDYYDTAIVTCLHEGYEYQGEPWTWRKDVVGVHDTLLRYSTIYGCDSLWHVRVTVNPVYFIQDTDYTCSNETYQWVGHNQTCTNLSPGVYVLYDSLESVAGCDSICQLTLNVIDTSVSYTRRTICDNDSLIWQGDVFRGDKWSGTGGTILGGSEFPYVFDRKHTSVLTGCDSVERLVVTVLKTDYTILDTAWLCQNDVFTFCGRDILCGQAGTFTYVDSLKNNLGCDSVVQVTLHVGALYLFEEYQTICNNSTWTWRGHTYSNLASGSYTETYSLQTVYGCDSDYVLHLTVVDSYLVDDTLSMCDYDVSVWRSRTLGPLSAGVYVYTDSMKTVQCGCDSVYRLVLKVHSSYYVHDTLRMCDNETIQVRTHTLCGPVGQYHYIDTIPTRYNCDSIVDLTVYVSPSYHFSQNVSMCSAVPYQWRGKTYRVSGTFYDSLKTVYGCDSVYELVLDLRPSYLFETYRTICSNESFVFHGATLRDDGDHLFSYKTLQGCDSDFIVHLTVLPSYLRDVYVSICANETYQFAGRTLTNTGIYYDTMRTTNGCDSVIALHLSVHPLYHMVSNVVICNDEIYPWQGRTLNQAGVYYDTLLSEHGCDSVLELHLSVNQSYKMMIDTTICDFQVFRWNGQVYNQTGTYSDNKKTSNGCDSSTVINLTVVPTVADSIFDTICVGETYSFAGRQLSKSGTYIDTVCQPELEDCRFRILHLLVNDPTVIDKATIPDICADDPDFFVDHQWHGAPPVRYTVLFDDEGHKQGFEDIVDEAYVDSIFVPVPSCVRYESYVRPDHYKVTLLFDNGGCDPQLNKYDLDMLVKYPSWIIEQNWDDVVSLLNRYFNGGYDFNAYYWVVNGTQHLDETGSYIYWRDKLQIGDHVYIMLQRQNEMYYLPSCEIQIVSHKGMDVNGTDLPFYVFNPDAQGALKINSLIDGNYILSDAAGRRLKEGTIKYGETQYLDLNYPKGVYFVYFYTEDGRSTVRKVVFY